jgi:hypothetical protein
MTRRKKFFYEKNGEKCNIFSMINIVENKEILKEDDDLPSLFI